MDYDVLLIGYGPVGATMANLLASAGISVGVVESAPTIYDKPRAVGLDQEALRIYQWAGLGERIDALCIDGSSADYVGIDGELIRRYVSIPPPYPLGWRPNVRFVQPELEALLREGAARYAHVTAHLATEALGFAQDAAAVAVEVRGPDGRMQTLRAKYLIGCDGSTSFVRRQLRTPIEDLAFDEWWIVLDAWIDADLQLPNRTIQYCWPKRPGTYVPGRDNIRRWEIKLLPGEKPEDFADEASVRAVLRDFVDDTKLRIWRRAVYRFHALVADGWRNGRVFLMGDAAHQMPPFMGQGLCSGIRDAGNLWWKLVAVLQGEAPPALLDTYEAERRPHVRALVALTKSVGLIIGELDHARGRERDARMRAEIAAGQQAVVRQNLIPGLTDGLLARGADGAIAAGAGQLFVQPVVTAPGGGDARLDDVTGPCFLLVTPSVDLVRALDDRSWAQLERLGARIVLIESASRPLGEAMHLPGVLRLGERDALFADWCGAERCVAALVRPDRYVFGVARSSGEVQALIAQLSARMGSGAVERS
jgi:3-(3-hydroxy-phenyl)propionate hydroxylase